MQKKLGLYNLINVPLKNRRGEIIGCLEIHNTKNRRPLGDKDVSLLKSLAASAAVALENAQLLKRSTETEKQLKNKIHQLEVFSKASIGRELKMKELKNKIRELERKTWGEDNA
jgi:transcriptional regulator with GAF, ATPase, and Fis domain